MTTPAPPPADTALWLNVELASATTIRSWSYGRITTHRLFDAKNQRFHHDGLYSEKIFGPIRDYQCACGKYFGSERVGIVCDECNVQVRPRSVRSQRMAHIELPIPILHPWFWGSDESPIELLLGLSHRQLKRLVTRRRFIELDRPGLALGSRLHRAREVRSGDADNLDGFLARSGANAVHTLLQRTHYVSLLGFLEEYLDYSENPAALTNPLAALFHGPGPLADAVRQSRRLRPRVELLRQVVRHEVTPQHAVLEVLPVIPAALRLGDVTAGGRVLIDSITDRYQRIICLCRSIERFLNRTADAHSQWLTGTARRALVWREKRLAAHIARLFHDLLAHGSTASQTERVRDRRRRWPGKRVDFSARSAVVPDPTLHLFECRVPRKEVADVLFGSDSPIDAQGASGARSAEPVANRRPLVFSFLPAAPSCDVISLLTRLTSDSATHVHPLLASSLDRSFADLAATIHVPLSLNANIDCDRLQFPRTALRDAVTGENKLRVAGDAAVGCFYATWVSNANREICDQLNGGTATPSPKLGIPDFASSGELLIACENGWLNVQDLVGVRLAAGQSIVRKMHEPIEDSSGKRRLWTTAGRVLLNSLLPAGTPFYDMPLDAHHIHGIVGALLEQHGPMAADIFVERACAFGLRVLTRSGLSLSMSDLAPPPKHTSKLWQILKQHSKLQRLFDRGVINEMERRSNVEHAARLGQEDMSQDHLGKLHAAGGAMPPLLAAMGGAGGFTMKQLHRLTAIIATVWSPWTRQLPAPVLRSFQSGVDPLGYFQLAAASRHECVHSHLKSKAPRRLQRRIATVLSEVVVTDDDCGVREGVTVNRDADAAPGTFAKQIAGRVILHDICDATTAGTIIDAHQPISPSAARKIEACGVSAVIVRSPLKCRASRGICCTCYGADPATGQVVKRGAAVGAKAALALGRPMLALHELQRPVSDDPEGLGQARASSSGVVLLGQICTVTDENSQRILVSASARLKIIDNDRVVESVLVPHGAEIHASTGSLVTPGTLLASWNARRPSVFAQEAGVVRIERRGIAGEVIYLQILDGEGAVRDACFLPADADAMVAEGDRVDVGALLATYLYRYWEWPTDRAERLKQLRSLVQMTPPRRRAVVAKIDGRVELKFVPGKNRCEILLHPTHGGRAMRVLVPFHPRRFITARTRQIVQAGDPLTTGTIHLGDLIETRGMEAACSIAYSQVQSLLAQLAKGQVGDHRHWELLVAHMLKYVRVDSSGDTQLKVGQIVTRNYVLGLNRELRNKVKVDVRAFPVRLESGVITREAYQAAEQQRAEANPGTPAPAATVPWPAGWTPLILGLEDLALQGSFLTSAGFVPSRKGLVRAAFHRGQRRIDRVQESFLAGLLMPAGSGWINRLSES